MTRQEAQRKLQPIQKRIQANNLLAEAAIAEGSVEDMYRVLMANADEIEQAWTLARIMMGKPVAS